MISTSKELRIMKSKTKNKKQKTKKQNSHSEFYPIQYDCKDNNLLRVNCIVMLYLKLNDCNNCLCLYAFIWQNFNNFSKVTTLDFLQFINVNC